MVSSPSAKRSRSSSARRSRAPSPRPAATGRRLHAGSGWTAGTYITWRDGSGCRRTSQTRWLCAGRNAPASSARFRRETAACALLYLLDVTRTLLLAALVFTACRHETALEQDDFIEVVPPTKGPDVSSTPEGHSLMAELTSAPQVPSKIFRRHPAHVIVELTINELETEISPGV